MEPVIDSKGFPTTDVGVNKILHVARKVDGEGFSNMNNDDIKAHLEEHRETVNETQRSHEILYR